MKSAVTSFCVRKKTKQKGKTCNRAYTSREPLLEHLLSCPLHKVYQPSPPKWLRVPLFSLSESCALCGLLRKQSGLFIKPARRGVSERESKRPSTCNSSEWDKCKHFSESVPFSSPPCTWFVSPHVALLTCALITAA